MSRSGSNLQIVKATNNVYTVLVICAFLAQVAAFALIYLRFAAIWGGNIFQS